MSSDPQPPQDDLIGRVFGDIHSALERRAHGLIRKERSGITLDTSGLLSEAWLRLKDDVRLAGQGEAAVVAAASRVMRRILVDHARARMASKRGGGPIGAAKRHTLRTADLAMSLPDDDLVDLNRALAELGELDQDLLQIVELRYFAGLTVERVAEIVGRSPRSVKRDWAWARAWLFKQLSS